ncbi:hypothetical protein FOXG_03965 [Fusarium oxysporum f. sp. lycopersici 4287]|nr:hypothetical protein FOXG_03965 [Fusarium oxysporum f. sp. lycopersici 4287]EXK44567.1 hypothetical protein FOMG_03267 [Fusarium oxysporum f. sp. melonis 26406]KAJ9427112.1 hypothetical protein QL093DRAFT_2031029 [Fusarium oxysporum]KNB00374.1 hypothetical protein FOXG_03965 [Fusarium oxysporum f. sp. lycopersici 4287]
MDDLLTRRALLLSELAELEDTISVFREAAGENEDFVDADSVIPFLSYRGNDNDNNEIGVENQVAIDVSDETFSDFPDSPDTTSQDEDMEMNEYSPQPALSKLSVLVTPEVALHHGPRQDSRFKQDKWLSEKPHGCFSRDLLKWVCGARLYNKLPHEMPVIFLAHSNAAECPANEPCGHWELRWDDRPRREPGTIELELICLDRKNHENFVDPPEQKFYLFDKDHPRLIKCEPCFLYNALKPDFSSLDATNLDLVIFRMIQPDDGEDNEPVDGLDEESNTNSCDKPYEQLGWTQVCRYMDASGRHFVTLFNE